MRPPAWRVPGRGWPAEQSKGNRQYRAGTVGRQTAEPGNKTNRGLNDPARINGMTRDASRGATIAPMEQELLTGRIIGRAMKVHRTLGPGYLESVYLNALALELDRAGLSM